MKKDNDYVTEHYGPIECEVDSVLKQVTLTVKRGRDPLGQGTIERCVNWAMSRIRDRYPNYHLMIDGQASDAAAT